MSNIAKVEKEPLSVKAAVEAPEFKRELARIVGDAIGADRVARMVVTSIARTPGLAECTPKSVLSAVYQAVQLGLTLDGRHAHLVPFRDGDKKVCTLVPDYKGLIQLALKSKIVTAITLETVCENDDFQWDRGVITHHKVDWRNPRGEAYAWYAIAKMSGGGEACVVLPRQEVEAIRARAKKGPKQSPWDTDFNEMAKKTAFKRLAKVLPLTPEFAEAERMESEEPTDVTPKATAGFERPQRTALPEASRTTEPAALEAPVDDSDLPPVLVGTEPVTAHDAVAKAIEEAGATFETFRAVAVHHKFDGAADWTEIQSVPADAAARLAKAKVGLVRELKAAAAGGAR